MKKMVNVSFLTLALLIGACSNQSVVEGKLLDGTGSPVPGIKIVASQVQPIKGYETAEALTGADGAFRMSGLFPSSDYVLKPSSDKWTCDTEAQLHSAPKGEIAVLPYPMIIFQAFSNNGGLVSDLVTGATRFTRSASGVITDSKTNLEWIVGTDEDLEPPQAIQWILECQVEEGGWRVPTRDELKTLYQEGLGPMNRDPIFDTNVMYVWAEPGGPGWFWRFDFQNNVDNSHHPGNARFGYTRAFGVRSAKSAGGMTTREGTVAPDAPQPPAPPAPTRGYVLPGEPLPPQPPAPPAPAPRKTE